MLLRSVFNTNDNSLKDKIVGFMKYTTTAILFVLLSISGTSSAVIIGDKDWRQVTETTGFSWNDFDAIFDTTTGACDAGGCLLGGTVDLNGYIWANNFEVNELLITYVGGAGIPNLAATSSVTYGIGELDAMFGDFACTFCRSDEELISGLTREQNDVDGAFADRIIFDNCLIDDECTNDMAGLNTRSEVSVPTPIRGGWVYRNVPEPSIIALFAVGLFGLGFARRRKVQS
jgi:hypothetical protein